MRTEGRKFRGMIESHTSIWWGLRFSVTSDLWRLGIRLGQASWAAGGGPVSRCAAPDLCLSAAVLLVRLTPGGRERAATHLPTPCKMQWITSPRLRPSSTPLPPAEVPRGPPSSRGLGTRVRVQRLGFQPGREFPSAVQHPGPQPLYPQPIRAQETREPVGVYAANQGAGRRLRTPHARRGCAAEAGQRGNQLPWDLRQMQQLLRMALSHPFLTSI